MWASTENPRSHLALSCDFGPDDLRQNVALRFREVPNQTWPLKVIKSIFKSILKDVGNKSKDAKIVTMCSRVFKPVKSRAAALLHSYTLSDQVN